MSIRLKRAIIFLLFSGVGYGTLISTFLFSIYYAVIIGWMLFYFVHSFFNPLPWATCDNWWNNEQCVISKSVPPADNITTTMNTSLTTILTTLFNFTETVTSVAPTSPAFNTSANTTMLMTTAARYSGRQETAAEQFWKYVVTLQNVVCCVSSAGPFKTSLKPTGWSQIRPLLWEQSDLGPHCSTVCSRRL